jgi:meiotically up-regulated gene 157 (Mug157) protein
MLQRASYIFYAIKIYCHEFDYRNIQKSEEKTQDHQQEVTSIETQMIEVKAEIDSLAEKATAVLAEREAAGVSYLLYFCTVACKYSW